MSKTDEQWELVMGIIYSLIWGSAEQPKQPPSEPESSESKAQTEKPTEPSKPAVVSRSPPLSLNKYEYPNIYGDYDSFDTHEREEEERNERSAIW